MEIKRVIPSGYCKGVVNAINLAKKTRQEYSNEKIYVLGMIVHNTYVTLELEKLGIITLDDTFKTKEELLKDINEGIIIFTAHGISDQIKDIVNKKGLKSVDATCEDVLKTREKVISYLDNGYDVIYYGKNKHPEAEAIISISNKIHLITSLDDIDKLNISNDKIFMTNQTTISFLELFHIFEKIKEKYPNIIISDETCDATTRRQKAIYDLDNCDVLYVVGDKKSNNTNKLVEIGKERGIKKVFLISNFKEINDEDLKDEYKVYVSAGASTPPILIDEVINYLSSKTF